MVLSQGCMVSTTGATPLAAGCACWPSQGPTLLLLLRPRCQQRSAPPPPLPWGTARVLPVARPPAAPHPADMPTKRRHVPTSFGGFPSPQPLPASLPPGNNYLDHWEQTATASFMHATLPSLVQNPLSAPCRSARGYRLPRRQRSTGHWWSISRPPPHNISCFNPRPHTGPPQACPRAPASWATGRSAWRCRCPPACCPPHR